MGHLPEQSTWRLLGLTVVTFGVYGAFYVKRQTVTLNDHLPISDRIPMVLPNAVVGLNLLSLAFLFPYLLVEEGHFMEAVSDLVDLPANLSFLVWGFAARARMNRLLSASTDQSSWFHGLWTFLFSPFYFNYKINCLASDPSATPPAA